MSEAKEKPYVPMVCKHTPESRQRLLKDLDAYDLAFENLFKAMREFTDASCRACPTDKWDDTEQTNEVWQKARSGFADLHRKMLAERNRIRKNKDVYWYDYL